MMKQEIQGRLERLRVEMANRSIDFYMIPTADFHSSEYVSDFFKAREYFSGFNGSSGTLLVWKEGAGLWTDGRYFIQAEEQLTGTGIELFRMSEEGVPTIEEYLKKEMKEGQKLGFDGRVVPASEGLKYEGIPGMKKKDQIVYHLDLAGVVWEDRPSLPSNPLILLPEELVGQSTKEKLNEVRKKMKAAGAEAFFLSKLDDLMWLFNVRGSDVECNPVSLSYGYITDKEAHLFIQFNALNQNAMRYFWKQGVHVVEYGQILQFLKNLPEGKKVLIDERCCSYAFYKTLQNKHKLIKEKNPTERLKAVKNPIELEHMEKVFLKDSLALTRFIYWLKTHMDREEITEISAANQLESFRKEIPEYLGPSFPTISAYGANAAMMHYEATPDSYHVLGKEGMLLVDSGGQYMGGTTDVTRTIALGPLTEEQKKHYTLVAAGMLQLTNVRWLHGCTGQNLDIMARQPIWDINLDYRCGTGHGIGYILNVHEGPQGIRWRSPSGATEAILEAGMVTTNEPGIYVEGSHGIRIENVMVVENGVKNEYGQFMYFKTLTYVPLDMDAIDEQYLTKEQKYDIDAYHKAVFEKLAPFLDENEREWLWGVCRLYN